MFLSIARMHMEFCHKLNSGNTIRTIFASLLVNHHLKSKNKRLRRMMMMFRLETIGLVESTVMVASIHFR